MLTLLLSPFKMILSEFDCFIEKKKKKVCNKNKPCVPIWMVYFRDAVLNKQTRDSGAIIYRWQTVSCPGRVYKHQKRTEACVIHPVHRLIMSLIKHVRQRATGLRGNTIGHWPLSQIPTCVDEGLRDVLSPFDSATVQKVSCSQQAHLRGSNNPPSSRHSVSICSLKRNTASDLDVKSCHQCFVKHFKSHCHCDLLCEAHPADLQSSTLIRGAAAILGRWSLRVDRWRSAVDLLLGKNRFWYEIRELECILKWNFIKSKSLDLMLVHEQSGLF